MECGEWRVESEEFSILLFSTLLSTCFQHGLLLVFSALWSYLHGVENNGKWQMTNDKW